MSDDQRSPHATGDHPMRRRCGAKTRSGALCKGMAMTNGRCRMHGGSSLSGVASPTFKTGRYSKAMPLSLRSGYEAARTDPELLSLIDEVALCQARLQELISRLQDGGAHHRRREIERTLAAVMTAHRRRDVVALEEAIERLGVAIDAADGDHDLWQEIHATLRLTASLALQESRRRVDMGGMVATEQALALFHELVVLVRQNVSDPTALRNIQRGMEAIIDGDDRVRRIG
jgi:hypothetical protein